MVRHAIDLGYGLAVMPVFRQEVVSRLTPTGFQDVLRTEVILYNAKGLTVIGRGESYKAPEDTDDPAKSAKLALGRALRDAGYILSRTDRDTIFRALVAEIKRQEAPQAAVQRIRETAAREGFGVVLDFVERAAR